MTDHPIYTATAAQEPHYEGGPRWVTVTDTARLMRATLARTFPGVRFYVRTERYAGGASIDVNYDGLDHWAPLTVCHCSDGPTIDPAYGSNQCQTCGYMGRLQPVMKPGAPIAADVEAALNGYSGSRFDGMIDMQYNVRSWLAPDGSASLGHNDGTGGQRGSDPGYDFPAPDPRAVKVNFGTSFVFVRHELPYGVAPRQPAAVTA